MSILTGDDYKRGWERGREDALNNKDRWNFKSSLAMGWSVKFAIYGSVALKTFTQGYNEGYKEGIKEKNITSKVKVENTKKEKRNYKSKITQNNMTQNYEQQLQALNELQSFLNQFKEDLKTRMSIYNDRVYGLRQSGLTVQIADNYDANYCVPNQQAISRLISDIEQRDIPFVNENIQIVQQALEIARKQYQ